MKKEGFRRKDNKKCKKLKRSLENRRKKGINKRRGKIQKEKITGKKRMER